MKSNDEAGMFLSSILESPFMKVCLKDVFSPTSTSNLCFANEFHFSYNSILVHTLSFKAQALAVEPTPPNGSSTLIPFFVKNKIRLSMS